LLFGGCSKGSGQGNVGVGVGVGGGVSVGSGVFVGVGASVIALRTNGRLSCPSFLKGPDIVKEGDAPEECCVLDAVGVADKTGVDIAWDEA